jgi:long-subunit acyl-CoA synthetase (AMP-forming)
MGMLRALAARLPLPREAMVSAMPMAHVAERTWTHYMPLAYGASSTCCPDRTQIFACLLETRPDVPFMVPRLWEHLRATLLARLDGLDDPALRAAVDARLARIRASERLGLASSEQDGAVERELRDRLLAGVGLDRVVVAYMGGAACPRDLVESVQALGIPVREGYGLTEATGFATVFPGLDDFRNGTAGRPIPGVELELAGDGEILLRSELNMRGYRGDPEGTRNAIDELGWLHTGDLGTLDDEGFLTVIGRKKDLIISSYGKNMSPVAIEDAITAESPLIGAAVAIGDARPYNVALLTLDPVAARTFADANGLPGATVADLAADPRVAAEVAAAVERANEQLSRPERVRAFELLDVAWTPDSVELTATMKVRRAAITAKYRDVIEELYAC